MNLSQIFNPQLLNAGFLLVLAGIFLVGVGAMLLPEKSAKVFGIPASSKESLAFIRAMGARDIAIAGMGVFCSSAWFILVVGLFSATDAILTKAYGSERWKIHALASLGLLIFAVLLWRADGSGSV